MPVQFNDIDVLVIEVETAVTNITVEGPDVTTIEVVEQGPPGPQGATGPGGGGSGNGATGATGPIGATGVAGSGSVDYVYPIEFGMNVNPASCYADAGLAPYVPDGTPTLLNTQDNAAENGGYVKSGNGVTSRTDLAVTENLGRQVRANIRFGPSGSESPVVYQVGYLPTPPGIGVLPYKLPMSVYRFVAANTDGTATTVSILVPDHEAPANGVIPKGWREEVSVSAASIVGQIVIVPGELGLGTHQLMRVTASGPWHDATEDIFGDVLLPVQMGTAWGGYPTLWQYVQGSVLPVAIQLGAIPIDDDTFEYPQWMQHDDGPAGDMIEMLHIIAQHMTVAHQATVVLDATAGDPTTDLDAGGVDWTNLRRTFTRTITDISGNDCTFSTEIDGVSGLNLAPGESITVEVDGGAWRSVAKSLAIAGIQGATGPIGATGANGSDGATGATGGGTVVARAVGFASATDGTATEITIAFRHEGEAASGAVPAGFKAIATIPLAAVPGVFGPFPFLIPVGDNWGVWQIAQSGAWTQISTPPGTQVIAIQSSAIGSELWLAGPSYFEENSQTADRVAFTDGTDGGYYDVTEIVTLTEALNFPMDDEVWAMPVQNVIVVDSSFDPTESRSLPTTIDGEEIVDDVRVLVAYDDGDSRTGVYETVHNGPWVKRPERIQRINMAVQQGNISLDSTENRHYSLWRRNPLDNIWHRINAFGPIGATGPQGFTGVRGSRWFVGSASPGSGNLEGDLFYDEANDILYVYSGSDYEYYTNLKGADGGEGATGPVGDTGATGPIGNTGVQGFTGFAGETGPIGASGAIGLSGSTGSQGFTGPIGATGSNGNVGATGAQGSTGVQGSSGPSGAGSVAFYGNGLDGDVTISAGTTTLSSDMYYNNLVVNGSLYTNNFKVYVKGTLSGNGTIHADGTAATNAGAAAAVAQGSLGGGGNFGTSGVTTTASPTSALGNKLGGSGGAGGNGTSGNGGAAQTGTAPTALRGGSKSYADVSVFSSGQLPGISGGLLAPNGGIGGSGGGGDGTNTGGGGGAGGGLVLVAANITTFTGLISAKGGNGATRVTGNVGGGGGGGGGVVVVVTNSTSQTFTTSVAGGTGGSGVGTGTAGSNGGAGRVVVYLGV